MAALLLEQAKRDNTKQAIENYKLLFVEVWKDTKYRTYKGDLYQETILK